MNTDRYRVGAWLVVFVFCASMMCFCGCSNQDLRGGPLGGMMDVVDSGQPYASKDTEAEALERAKKLSKVLAQSKNEPEGVREYHIGAEDVLDIGVLSLEEPGKVSKLLRTVQDNGTIQMPWIGDVKVVGLTAVQVRQALLKALTGRYIKEPEVTVELAQYRSAQVVITGAVNKPGIYYLSRDRRSLLEMLAEADGLNRDAGDEVLVIRATGTNIVVKGTNVASSVAEAPRELAAIDLRELIDRGDLRLNVAIRAGDVITVTPRAKEVVYVLGYVARPGGYTIAKSKVGALEAVALAGGLLATARAENSWLLRRTQEGQKVVPVDLTKIARGTRPPLDLEAGDTLVIGSSLLARLSEFVRPSIGASVGASYSPVP